MILITVLILTYICTYHFAAGALSIEDVEGNVSVTRSDFSGNTAEGDGGALIIFDVDGTISVTGSKFKDNEVEEKGGMLL